LAKVSKTEKHDARGNSGKHYRKIECPLSSNPDKTRVFNSKVPFDMLVFNSNQALEIAETL